jgi:thymidine kinase
MIKLFIGPVSSGKTREMLLTIDRAYYSGKRCIVLKPMIDVRTSGDSVESRQGGYNRATVIRSERILSALSEEDVMNADVVGIDEAQFFPDLLEGVTRIRSMGMGKAVIVAGLDASWKGTPFPTDGITSDPLQLIPHCDKAKKLTARCTYCGKRAMYSIRTPAAPMAPATPATPATSATPASTSLISIGGSEKFIPVCLECRRKYY